MVQVVEQLPSKCKVLSSNPRTAQKEKKKKKREYTAAVFLSPSKSSVDTKIR
jgi:hypothetical protein